MPDGRVTAARRRSGVLLALLVTLGAAILIALGTWQLDRLRWKEALIAERRAAIAAPPVDLATPAAGASLPDYRHVRVRGSFLPDRELLVGPRTQNGNAGWRVIAPLALDGGGFVLVDRGFVPDALKRPESRPAGRAVGPAAVAGLLRRPGEPGPFQPPNEPEKGAWFSVEPAAMGRALGLVDIAPYWVAADATANAGGWPAGGGDAAMPANNHLQYAITWYSLAAGLLAVYALFRRRERRDAAQADRASRA